MASWNGKTWGVSPERIAALNGVSASVELDTENSDDKAGSPATKTKALKLQSMSFDFDLGVAVGCDVRGEYESWTALVGQYAPFYLGGTRFGPANHHQPDGVRRGGQQQEGDRRQLQRGQLVPGRSLHRRRPAPERHHRRRIQQRQSCKETQQHPTDLKRGDPMKASGNATPETCVQNLLKTIRGEVPYERIKGIDRTLIDKPSGAAANDLAADVEFVVETYEPRVRLSSSDLVALVAQTGDFELRASIDNNTL